MNIVVLAVGFLFLLGLPLGIAIAWYARQRRQASQEKMPAKKTAVTDGLAFRWRYITLPLLLLLLSLVFAACSYHLMPAEVAYRFNIDGTPKSSLGLHYYMLLAILPQLLLALVAMAVTWGTSRMGRAFGWAGGTSRLERVLLLMGNMVALPQIVLAFVILDIFSYNVYGTHLLPIWLFTLIIMAIGGIILTVFFIQAYQHSRTFIDSDSQQEPEE